MESALDTIIQSYVNEELHCENEIQVPEGQLEKGDSNFPIAEKPFNINSNYNYAADANNYTQVLHDCLEKKGILRELQGFLRHKLVLVLQDKFPKLNSPSSNDVIHPLVIKLIQDFLSCRKLLYSLSVLSGELGLHSNSGQSTLSSKMSCESAERLLYEFGIKRNSSLSDMIIKTYKERTDLSLLECIIDFSSSGGLLNTSPSPPTDDHPPPPIPHIKDKGGTKTELTKRLRKADEFYNQQHQKQNKQEKTHVNPEERLRRLQVYLENDKETQLQLAKDKFRQEEEEKIREELKRQLEFQLVAKENELLLNYKERSQSLQEAFEREKMVWLTEKAQQETQLEIRERELQLLMNEFLGKKSEFNIRDPFRCQSGAVGMNPTPSQHQKFQNEKSILRKIPENPHQSNKSKTELNRNRNEDSQIAHLQYNLSLQSQEIKKLKEQIQMNSNPNLIRRPPPQPGQPLFNTINRNALRNGSTGGPSTSEIVKFLSESKRRCQQIEVESKNLDEKLQEIKMNRRSRSASPAALFYSHKNPSESNSLVIPGPYSTIMPQLISEEMQILKLPSSTRINNLFNGVSSSAQLSRSREPLRGRLSSQFALTSIPPHLDRITYAEASLSSFREQSAQGQSQSQVPPNPKSYPNKSLTQNDIKAENIVKQRHSKEQDIEEESNSNSDDKNKKSISDRQSPDVKNSPGVRIASTPNPPSRSPPSIEKVKVVKRGPLSFEKVTTSDDESSQQSSLRQDSSAKIRNQLSFNKNTISNANSGGSYKVLMETEQEDVKKNKEKDTEQEPVKLQGLSKNTEEDKSLSISYSAPNNDISGNDDDSEFWKL